MTRLLQRPALDGAPRALAAPAPSVDAFTAALLEQAQTAAYERGQREGYAAGVAAGRHQAVVDHERAHGAVISALQTVAGELQALRAQQAHSSVELATAIAEFVLGREPHDEGQALLARVRDTVARIDDTDLVLHVHPADLEQLTRGLSDLPFVTPVADSQLAPGEARIVGRWAQAEILRATAWEAIREVLGA